MRTPVIHACGHSSVVTVRRGQSVAREEQRLCRRCHREQEAEAAEAAAQAEGLPPLTGTRREVAQAMVLRHRRLQEIDALIAQHEEQLEQVPDNERAERAEVLGYMCTARAQIAAQQAARYWVNWSIDTARYHLKETWIMVWARTPKERSNRRETVRLCYLVGGTKDNTPDHSSRRSLPPSTGALRRNLI